MVSYKYDGVAASADVVHSRYVKPAAAAFDQLEDFKRGQRPCFRIVSSLYCLLASLQYDGAVFADKEKSGVQSNPIQEGAAGILARQVRIRRKIFC